ncbi:hypothetical protein T492DRAFT_1060246 [Pavlovales sp. CCMP2436]|nr:hypothetical protein T492DRAFT_1060246 [Pavlovales sp. CCMP2436]
MLVLVLLCLASHYATEHVAKGGVVRGVVGGGEEDDERQQLAAHVLAMPPARVRELRADLERQQRLANMMGGGVLRSSSGPNGAPGKSRWEMHRAPDGTRYYVDLDSGITSWEVPAELRGLKYWDHRKTAADLALPPEFE